jgi:hypothetical protein
MQLPPNVGKIVDIILYIIFGSLILIAIVTLIYRFFTKTLF